MKSKIHVIYPPGCGGEFLSWAISTQPGFNPLAIYEITNENKWCQEPDQKQQDVIPWHGDYFYYSQTDDPSDYYPEYSEWVNKVSNDLFIVITDNKHLRKPLVESKNKVYEHINYNYKLQRIPGPYITIDFEQLIVEPHPGLFELIDFLKLHNRNITPSFKWLYEQWIKSNTI